MIYATGVRCPIECAVRVHHDTAEGGATVIPAVEIIQDGNGPVRPTRSGRGQLENVTLIVGAAKKGRAIENAVCISAQGPGRIVTGLPALWEHIERGLRGYRRGGWKQG
jgi:hypothetical protein